MSTIHSRPNSLSLIFQLERANIIRDGRAAVCKELSLEVERLRREIFRWIDSDAILINEDGVIERISSALLAVRDELECLSDPEE